MKTRPTTEIRHAEDLPPQPYHERNLMKTNAQTIDRVAAVRGLENVVAGQTRICTVDGVEGRLIYSGYEIRDLARHASFAESVYLLWFGDLPNQSQLKTFHDQLVNEMRLPSQVIEMIKLAPPSAHPMDLLRTAVSALGMYDPDAGDRSDAACQRKATRLLAQTVTLVADMHRVRHGLPVLSADTRLGFGANFLYLLRGETPTTAEYAAFELLLMLHLEHGLNASTFAARVTASTLSDMHAALTSGLGTLKGPLHGGASERAIEIFERVDDIAEIEEYIDGMLNSGKRIMGFGHRVYKTEDPRARLLREHALSLCRSSGLMELAEQAEHVEALVLAKKGIFPNVDFYSGIVQHALGIPKTYTTAIFACARTAGWLAHIREQYGDNRLIRPTSDYIGPKNRTAVPIEQRS
jgi:citrate synthase